MIPVLYEIDTSTMEATGTVHPFCSEKCRQKFAVDVNTPAAEGCAFVEGEENTGMGAFPEDSRCDFCGEPLDDVFHRIGTPGLDNCPTHAMIE